MKLALFVAVVSMSVVAVGASAQESSSVPYITVSGYAEDWVESDTAVLSIVIAQKGDDLPELKATSDRELNNLLTLVNEFGVSPEQVNGGRASSSKKYELDKNGSATDKFSHFDLSRNISVRLRDFGKAEALFNELLQSEELNVRVEYTYSKADSVLSELRLRAVSSARKKATDMAEILGATLGLPLIISEFPIISDYQQFDHLSRQAGVVMRPNPERVHLRQTVYVRFALESKTGPGNGP